MAADIFRILIDAYTFLSENFPDLAWWQILIAVIIIAVLGFAIYRLRNSLFPDTFGERSKCFKYRFNPDVDEVTNTYDGHLRARNLLSDVSPMEVYGKFTKEKGKPPRVELKEKIAPNRDKQMLKYIRGCIQPFSISVEDKHPGVEDVYREEATSDFLIDNYILPCLYDPKPALIMVHGKVGCGKSTLMMNLAARVLGKNKESEDKQVLTVLVDVRKLLHCKFELDDNDFQPTSMAHFPDQAISYIESEIARLLGKGNIDGVNQSIGLQEAVERCFAKRVSPLIILDEMDFLYTDFLKRAVLCKSGQQKEVLKNAYTQLFKKICSLHVDSAPTGTGDAEIGNYPLNAIFVVVSRSSTEEIMRSIVGSDDLDYKYSVDVKDVNNKKAIKIIVSQLEVLKRDLRGGEGTTTLKEMIEFYKTNDVNYSKNISYSVHGVRHLINSIVKLLGTDMNYKLFSEVARRPGILRLYQYIDGNMEYSQAEEGISNIFLVNNKAAQTYINKRGVHGNSELSLCGDHLQSYWLKYFICKYINEKSKICANNQVPYQEVISLFHPKKSSECHKYERSIVELVILHAAKVDHGRLLVFHSTGQGFMLSPSERLMKIMEVDLFWDFGYLMVAIEDKWLEFPKKLFPSLMPKEGKRVFDFVTNFDHSSSEDKLSFIKTKLHQVKTFLLILEAALEDEQLRYSYVYRKLEESGVEINMMDVYIDHLNSSIINFTRKHVGENHVDHVKREIDKWDKEKADKIKKTIKNSFSDYHNKPHARSDSYLMKKYYTKRNKH
ncbi:hypothetical protein ACFL3K_01285 [Pseudomonadota bacterium]